MMKAKRRKPYAGFILLTEAVGGLSALLTRSGMKAYGQSVKKPALMPPEAAFPIVWALLFLLMGIGAARVWLAPRSVIRTRGLRLFLVQLAVNFSWSFFFFRLQAFGFSFFWLLLLWLLALSMLLSFARADKGAGLLQIPYQLWLTFAAYLNLGVWLLNR